MTHETLPIGGGYSYTAMNAGVILCNPAGVRVYFQPGDDTANFYETLEALDEIPDGKRDIIADMAFGDYFA